MEKTTFVFHTGLDTIGAVILEVRYGNDRVFFEAGTAYNPSFDMFDSKVALRKSMISDFLWVNELPRINGIYRKEDIENYDIKPASWFKGRQAFFITHLHLDHMRMMGMIDPSVDVYLTKQAQSIELALEEVCKGVEHIRNNYLDIPDEVTIGQIHVKKFIINDDSYQDLSFYIETPDLHMHYTGDVFAYGKYQINLRKEIEYITNRKVDLLVCEGTQFWGELPVEKYNKKHQLEEDPNTMLTKEDFDAYNIELLSNYEGLVVLNYYEREMSDVMDYERFAKQANREIVYEPFSAHIINKFFHKSVKIMLPDNNSIHQPCMKEILTNNVVITKEEVMTNPRKYIVQNTYPNLLELLDYRNMKTMYLHHSGTPLGDFDPAMKTLMNIVKHCNFDYVSSKRKDGRIFNSHAAIEQLLGYIDLVNPSLLIPCHSANRKAYAMNLERPYYWANLKEVYTYNKEKNTLEVIDYEK